MDRQSNDAPGQSQDNKNIKITYYNGGLFKLWKDSKN